MADFAPPPGPPPPRVPEGWKAVFNDQYKEWFYVNTHTKASQWDKPTEPVYGSAGGAPPGAPPNYDHNSSQATGPEKSNNPYHQSGGQDNMMSDEALARKLQAEEQSRGASDSFYGQGQQSQQQYGQSSGQYGQQDLPPREQKSKGLLGKLSSKLGGGSSSRPQQYGGYQQSYPQQQYQQQYPPQQYQQYPPQQRFGGPGYGAPMGGGMGGYGGGYGGAPPRRGGGLGAGGGMALGAGAGLLGGALLMEGMENHDENEYNEGYQDGADDGGGGDDGGGDDGGGD